METPPQTACSRAALSRGAESPGLGRLQMQLDPGAASRAPGDPSWAYHPPIPLGLVSLRRTSGWRRYCGPNSHIPRSASPTYLGAKCAPESSGGSLPAHPCLWLQEHGSLIRCLTRTLGHGEALTGTYEMVGKPAGHTKLDSHSWAQHGPQAAAPYTSGPGPWGAGLVDWPGEGEAGPPRLLGGSMGAQG